ncbi:MAG: nucleoside deaminase [Holosporaceae bacterium]|jgi:tRNA(Arg) A34 adenosine deaminase TadA|nr:nucleoside deaminase [Holosporaceae bacterium]
MKKTCGYFMELAIEEAKNAGLRGSVPVGAVIVYHNDVQSAAGNETIRSCDPTAHAEILAIQRACASLGSCILEECDMFVTLEPCAMCAQAISLSGIRRLYFGAYDIKCGAIEHGPRVFKFSQRRVDVVGGIRETECGDLLRIFFREIRQQKQATV